MNQRQPPHFPKSPLKGKANGSISSSELEDKVGEGADERTTVINTVSTHHILERENKTYIILPSGPLLVYPKANNTLAKAQRPPRAPANLGYWSPEMRREPRKGVRFSVKLLWARWAQLKR